MGASLARHRAALLLVGLAAGWLPLLWLVGPALSNDASSQEESVAAVLAWALVGCWAWWCAAAGVVALEVAATGTARRTTHLAPRAARTLVVAVCGAGVIGGLAGPAVADPVGGRPHVQLLDGLALPDRPVGRVHSPVPTHPQRTDPASEPRLTVRAGDSLWAIAQELGIDWRDLYAANRAVIGTDPDLIQPGQRLVLPSHPTHEGAHR